MSRYEYKLRDYGIEFCMSFGLKLVGERKEQVEKKRELERRVMKVNIGGRQNICVN